MAFDEAHATSGIQSTLVAVWRGDPTPHRVRDLADQMRAIAERSSGRVYLLNVITASTPVPSAAARAALQREWAAMRGTLMAAAIVLEKGGIEGTLSRAVLSTIATATRQPFPMRVFASRRDAATWLVGSGCGTSVAALTNLAESLEQKLVHGALRPTSLPPRDE